MSVFAERNFAAILILLAALTMLLLVISVPTLQHLFSFQFPGYSHFITSVLGALGILIILETVKYLKNRRIRMSGKYASR